MDNITFKPVYVFRGRKFRGPAFDLGYNYSSRFGYAGSGVCPLQITVKEKLWDPITQQTVYVNADYLEKREISDEELNEELEKYVKHTIQETITYCMSKSKTQDDGFAFARNCLMKYHPEMREHIENELPTYNEVSMA